MSKQNQKEHKKSKKSSDSKKASSRKSIEVLQDIIVVDHLSKSFKLPTERSWGLKQVIFNRLKGIKGYTKQELYSKFLPRSIPLILAQSLLVVPWFLLLNLA